MQIALIPLDVANIRSEYDLSMYSAWMIILITNVILMILVIPYILFFYETDPEANVLTRVADSICSYICFVMFFLAAWLIVHFVGNSYTVTTLHKVQDFRMAVLSKQPLNSFGNLLPTGNSPGARPVEDHSGSHSWNPFDWKAVNESYQKSESFSFTVSTNLLMSLVGVVCFVGYALLSLYLGNGLITLPYNLVYKWWQRPKKLSSVEMKLERDKVQRRLRKLIDEAKDLKSRLSSLRRAREHRD